MNNIQKCSRCKKTLIEEEFSIHVCTPTIIERKDILIDYCIEVKNNENGDRVFLAKGLDGILYRLIKCVHNPVHQPTGNTNNNSREDNSTILAVLLP